MGGSHTCSLLILVILIGSLSVQPEMVCSLSSMDHILRRNAAERPTGSRDARRSPEATPPEPSDPNRTSERRVRRGSNPIHNRC